MPVAPALVLFKDAYLSTVAGFGSALTSSPIGVMGNKSVFDAHLLAMDTGSILDIFVDASASGEEWIQIQASEAKSLADPVNGSAPQPERLTSRKTKSKGSARAATACSVFAATWVLQPQDLKFLAKDDANRRSSSTIKTLLLFRFTGAPGELHQLQRQEVGGVQMNVNAAVPAGERQRAYAPGFARARTF